MQSHGQSIFGLTCWLDVRHSQETTFGWSFFGRFVPRWVREAGAALDYTARTLAEQSVDNPPSRME